MATIEQLKVYIKRASNLDPEDTNGFHSMIRDGLKLLIITDDFLANKISMSRSSVNRWKNGRNAPHPIMRKGVIALLIRQANLALNALKQNCSIKE